jgi:uncharacterized protein YegL
MGQSGGRLLPFYLVIDVSASMASDGKLEAVDAIMPAVTEALARNPAVSGKVRFGLIDFAGTASVRLPLCDVLEDGLGLPRLTARDGTRYAAAFTLLQREIEADVAQLKANGFVVHRPAVWFISDGAAADDPADWQAAFKRLTTCRVYPNVIPCGVDAARTDVMGALVHPPAGPRKAALYMMEPGTHPAKAITSITEIIISSAIQSGYCLGHGDTGVILPRMADLPAGVTQFDPDDVL